VGARLKASFIDVSGGRHSVVFVVQHEVAGIADISSSEFKLSLTKLIYEHFVAGR
jgi:hypothetical protein